MFATITANNLSKVGFLGRDILQTQASIRKPLTNISIHPLLTIYYTLYNFISYMVLCKLYKLSELYTFYHTQNSLSILFFRNFRSFLKTFLDLCSSFRTVYIIADSCLTVNTFSKFL